MPATRSKPLKASQALGSHIRDGADRADLSQMQISRLTGRSQAAISHLMRGSRAATRDTPYFGTRTFRGKPVLLEVVLDCITSELQRQGHPYKAWRAEAWRLLADAQLEWAVEKTQRTIAGRRWKRCSPQTVVDLQQRREQKLAHERYRDSATHPAGSKTKTRRASR